MKELSNDKLLQLYRSSLDYCIVLNDEDKTIIETNNEDEYENIINKMDIYLVFYPSDFENYFDLQNILKDKGLADAI